MTEPSEAAKRKACELTNAQMPSGVARWSTGDVYPYAHTAPLYALALHLDEVDRVAREVELGVWETGDPDAREKVRSLMLPDPPDPLREACDAAFNATRGLTDGAYGRDRFVEGVRAELDKRGYKLVKETPDD